MRTRNFVVVVTGVAVLFFSLLALDLRFREDDEGGGGEAAPPGDPQAAELVTQPDLSRRSELDPAQGAADSATTLDEAMVRLRAYAFAESRPLGEVAHDVVTRRLRFDQNLP